MRARDARPQSKTLVRLAEVVEQKGTGDNTTYTLKWVDGSYDTADTTPTLTATARSTTVTFVAMSLADASYSAGDIVLVAWVGGRYYILDGGGGCSQNEIQQITVFGSPTGGTFDLYFNDVAVTINYDDTAAEVETALEGHDDIAAGDVSVTGGPLPDATIEVEFTGGLAQTDVPIMRADWGSLTGGSGVGVLVSVDQQGAPNAFGTVNEIQLLTITGSPTGGTFTLTLDGQTTSGIAYNASAATVQAAIEALSNVGSGNVTCTGSDLPAETIKIEFIGDLAETDVDLMTANSGSLTGGSTPTASVAVDREGGPNAF